MTQLTFSIGVVNAVVCVALIMHVVFSKTRAKTKPAEMAWWVLWIRAALECVSIWIWLAVVFPLLAWMFWIGDNEHWFYSSAWVFAAIIAVAISSLSAFRLRTGNVGTHYARIHLWGPLFLTLSFAAIGTYEYVREIEGISPDAAAQHVLQRISPHINEPVRLVEYKGPLPHGLNASRCKCYWIMGASEPRGRLSVCKYGRFWWRFSHSERFPPSSEELERAKDWLQQSGNRHGAVSILRSVVENYPDTPAEAEARTLLRTLGEQN